MVNQETPPAKRFQARGQVAVKLLELFGQPVEVLPIHIRPRRVQRNQLVTHHLRLLLGEDRAEPDVRVKLVLGMEPVRFVAFVMFRRSQFEA